VYERLCEPGSIQEKRKEKLMSNQEVSRGPDLFLWNFSNYWVYIVGLIAGGFLAIGIVYILRGRGGSQSGIEDEQGRLQEIVAENTEQPLESADNR
jgi:hypothetical protein